MIIQTMATQVRTNVLFPVYHSSSRTEFRLDNSKVYLNTWRLANIQPKPSGPIAYTPALACGSLIQNITLFSGDTPIDESRNTHEYLAFEALRSSNAVSLDILHETNGTHWGFKVGPRNANHIPTIVYTDATPSVKPDENAALATSATLNLQKCLPYLAADDIVPATKIPNLRLVITWRAGAGGDVFAGVSGAITYSMQEPQLFLDEIVSPEVLAKVNQQKSLSIPYFSLEQDRIKIPVVADGVHRTDTIRINGFNNKSVRRMLLVNVPSAIGNAATDRIKADASIAQHQETFNFRLNGRNYFALGGVDQANKKLDTLAFAWGSISLPQGCQFDKLAKATADNFLSDDVSYVQGRLSYGGFWLSDRISDMEVVYSRKGRAAGYQQLAEFPLDVYGEVAKVLQVGANGRVTVSYS